jgi:hypothetical protein
MSSSYGRTPKDGACNRLQDIGMFHPYYCHRPAGEDGICGVHRGADKRGQQNRERAAARRRHAAAARRQA